MSLGGSLEDLSLLDILQIVNVSRRTGALRLDLPSTGRTFIFFSNGSVTDIVGGFDENSFIRFFLEQGLLEESELVQAREATNGDPAAILKWLIDGKILNARLAEQARGLEISRRLKALTEEEKGEFDFFLTESGDSLEEGAPEQFCSLSTPASPQNLLTQTVTADNFSEWVPASQLGPSPAPKAESEVSTELAEENKQAPHPEIPEVLEVKPAGDELVETEPVGASVEYKPSPRVVPAKNQITILLASGQSIFVTLLKRRLVEHFADVIVVSSKTEYLSVCRKLLADHTPFLGLVDLLMASESGEGYLGGLEIIQASSSRFPKVKVMMMSDLQDEDILKVARSHGAIEILQKPGLANLHVDEFETSIKAFSENLCRKVDALLPPQDEEIANFLRDLGSEGRGDKITNQLTLLKGLMGELASPKESSEISLLVLRLAAEYFERAILFLVKKDTYAGLGGFGETGESERMMEKVRRISIPNGVNSVFDEAVKNRATASRQEADFSRADIEFSSALGPYTPPSMTAIPMVSRRRVIAILYGDNAVSGEPMTDLTGLEIFMTQAGMAMEKALLEMQLLHLQRHLPNKNNQT